MNRKIFRIINRWYDATNDEVISLPDFKPIELLAHNHFAKLLTTINPYSTSRGRFIAFCRIRLGQKKGWYYKG